MNKRIKVDFPGIVYSTATLLGVLLFIFFGEKITGRQLNWVWIAWLTGFLFALGVLWIWQHWRKGN